MSSRSDAGTYLYVKDGAQPRDVPVLPARRALGLDPPHPDEPASRVRLVRPVIHAQRCDPHLSMLHCPDSPLGDVIRGIVTPLEALEGPIVITGTPAAPIGRLALELSAALVETGGFAGLVDAGAGVAGLLGIDRFDGLLSQSRQRARDPARPLELLYVTWRCGLLPLEPDQAVEPEAVALALAALEAACSCLLVAAPPTGDPASRTLAGLGHVVLVTTPDEATGGQLATAVAALAGERLAGVIVAPPDARATP